MLTHNRSHWIVKLNLGRLWVYLNFDIFGGLLALFFIGRDKVIRLLHGGILGHFIQLVRIVLNRLIIIFFIFLIILIDINLTALIRLQNLTLAFHVTYIIWIFILRFTAFVFTKDDTVAVSKTGIVREFFRLILRKRGSLLDSTKLQNDFHRLWDLITCVRFRLFKFGSEIYDNLGCRLFGQIDWGKVSFDVDGLAG